MSYERLAERLIETQQTMLGQRAVDIAASIDGLTVADDGSVSNVADDDRAVVAALVEEYTTIMGSSAANRLESTAAEFDADLTLPQNLGGPETVPDDAETATDDPSTDATERPETAPDETASTPADDEPTATDQSAAEPVRKATNPPTIDDITEPSASESAPSTPKPSQNGGSVVESHDKVTNLWESDDDADEAPADDTGAEEGVPDADATTGDAGDDGAAAAVEQSDSGTESTRTASAADDEQNQLPSVDSVYVTRTDENGWETPVSVGTAITDAIVEATALEVGDIDDIAAYVDTDRIVTLLETDRSIPVSFRVEGHSVTLHPDGDVTVE